jgi:hypothetical protein
MLLSDAFLAALSNDELFFLAVACHYHDLAMAGTEADDRSPETREQVRRDHAIRIGEIIRQRWMELGFEDERTAQVLGEICRGHRPTKNSEGQAQWDELNSVEVLRPGVSVRVRLLAALTYAIDELHLGADRAPARVQRWRDIRDEESRRHWRRHQHISGPDLTHSGSLCFQVNADTPGFEENLRAQVFQKALAAVRDLCRQAQVDGVTVTLPQIEIQWNRKKSWETFLPIVCSDLQLRSKDEVVQAMLDRFAELTANRTDLSGLSLERGNTPEELRAGADRCAGDAITFGRLVASTNSSGLVLSADEAVADVLFSKMRESDDLDRMFLGRYRASWEERLFESPYGRSYVDRCVLPAVQRSYSVPLTQRPGTEPLRVILETSPTAARLVREFGPPPSNLVKDALLAHAALCGVLFDLYADPERLLDRRLRSAVHELGDPNAVIVPTLRLLEEMALVGGFTTEQVVEAHSISDAARQALSAAYRGPEPTIQIGLSQSVPAEAPAQSTHLPRLLLASQRAGTPILFTNAPGHELDLQVSPEAGLPTPANDGLLFGVGPGEPIGGSLSRLPARIEISRSSRTVRIYLGRYNADGPTSYPLVVTLPALPRSGELPTVNLGAFIQWPELTVRNLRSLDAANQLIRSGRASLELLVEDTSGLVAAMDAPRGGDLFRLGPWTPDVLRGLRNLDGNLPAPLFVPRARIMDLAHLSASEREAAWLQLRGAPSGGAPRNSSLFFRMSTDTGRPTEERFLRFLPFDVFPAPTIENNETMTPEEFKRRWELADGNFVITAYFQSDVYDLCQSLRDWCRSPSGAFPFRFERDAVDSPLTRSALNIRFLGARSRVWHVDRPIIFEFRPVNRAEAYEREATYWRSVKDERRAELADEIRGRLTGSPNAGRENQ